MYNYLVNYSQLFYNLIPRFANQIMLRNFYPSLLAVNNVRSRNNMALMLSTFLKVN